MYKSREMLQRLGVQKFCPIISVAGTNGKGTTSHLLAVTLAASGKRVGLFTSPHLLHFNERIQINGVPVPDTEIAVAFEQIEQHAAGLELGYFDKAFLAMILIFKLKNLDILVLEVGIGGRLDAVNSLDADVAVITTLDFDHTEILGPTLEDIAFEKAGIFRPGQAAICGVAAPPSQLQAHASALGAQLYIRGEAFEFERITAKTWSARTPFGVSGPLPLPRIPLQNALTALMTLQVLDALGLFVFDITVFKHSLQTLIVPGRMQHIRHAPEILVDVAHNPESARYLCDYLTQHPCKGRTYAVFSALKDKNIVEIVAPLQTLVERWYVFELAEPRRASLKELVAPLPAGRYETYTLMPILQNNLLNHVTPADRIVVFGSFMLVAAFLNHLQPGR